MNSRARKRIRAQLMEDNPRCIWCGYYFHPSAVYGVFGTNEKFPTIEHIWPKSHGGTDEFSNLALACKECNK